jgi:hypothetical protein
LAVCPRTRCARTGRDVYRRHARGIEPGDGALRGQGWHTASPPSGTGRRSEPLPPAVRCNPGRTPYFAWGRYLDPQIRVAPCMPAPAAQTLPLAINLPLDGSITTTNILGRLDGVRGGCRRRSI